MDIVKSDNLPQGQMPTIFEDRTLFPPPSVVDAKFSERRGGGGVVVPLLIFGFMLIPLLGIGWFAWQSSQQVGALTAEIKKMDVAGTEAKIADLNTKINSITVERDALNVQIATLNQNKGMFEQDIGRLVNESAALVKEIDDLLAGPRRGRAPLPANLRTVPPTWDDAAIAILQGHVDALKAHRLKVIGTTPVVIQPVEGTITGQ